MVNEETTLAPTNKGTKTTLLKYTGIAIFLFRRLLPSLLTPLLVSRGFCLF